jgi:hypothetical protein
MTTYRDHGFAPARERRHAPMAELFGKDTGCPGLGSMHVR